MEALQLSGDGCTQQRSLVLDVEALSTQVSNLTMQPEKKLPQEVSICISSTTEEGDDESCITISDSSDSEQQEQAKQPPAQETSMTVSGQLAPTAAAEQLLPDPLSNDKVKLIEAFLRDVSFERRERIRRGQSDVSAEHTRLASADTESMSQLDVDLTQLPSRPNTPTSTPKAQLDSSKRLADNDTEINTLCSEERFELDNSKRLASNETEVNTPDPEEPLSELSAQQSTLNEVHLDETIPETSSEVEPSPLRPSSSSSAEEVASMPAIQVSSINISAKINIKIHIPNMDSSSAESDHSEQSYVQAVPSAEARAEPQQQERVEQQQLQQECEQEQERSVLSGDASEDEQFLTQAEKLLNQLYGKSWQTPDVIRTLKRSSGSGGKAPPAIGRTPLTEIRRQPKAQRAAATTAKKAATTAKKAATTAKKAAPNESALGDFSIFKRALHSTKLNSTHFPESACSEKRPNGQRARTNHVHEERWRALVDTDSGTDASDDDDADATGSSEPDDAPDGHVTYLDLTKTEVEVVSDPDEQIESPKFPKRLDDILRTCRASDKPKLPATPKPTSPSTPALSNPTRRQLFTPNTGYEDISSAKRIVDQALDLDSLDQLENVYLPGSTVHKRVQEVKKQLGIAVESPKAKPIFKLPTPQTAPPAKSGERAKKVLNGLSTPKNIASKCSFIKSLEPQISRDRCDNEAFFYRENFSRNKEQLAARLYDMFNEQIFNNELKVPITWSKLLRNTAGRCKNKKKLLERSSVVELSIKVLTSADRLRCTLIHELCHAAAWVFNGEGGHGLVWKRWAQRANEKFPDLPPIRVCHNYNIEFKYTYKCIKCNTSSHAHSRSRKVENLRCRICRGPIMLLLNKKDKSGNIVPTPVREATGFAKFVKDNFQKHKRDNLTAAQVMRILGAEYAKEKGKGQLTKTDEAAAQAFIVDRVETLTLDSDEDH
ncbi:germ cell nuclear acidic protein [Drosophila montana]|uniref:germ cell nuclear acidic protein n=1 Tax=Drosophila montana TaxID=40370 RepID=UPI00313BD874